jgi:hypothetical protein
MAFIGEEHYCAERVDKIDGDIIFSKQIAEENIVSMIIRITAQLAGLSLSFKKYKNTRVIYLDDHTMTLSFYFHDQFYVVQTLSSSQATFILKTLQIGEFIRSILDDMQRPLFNYIPNITDEKICENILSS